MGFVKVGRPTLPSNLSAEASSGSLVMISTQIPVFLCPITHFEKVFELFPRTS